MKLFLVFFIFFLSLSSFIAGWILRDNYEQGAFQGFQQIEEKIIVERDVSPTEKTSKKDEASLSQDSLSGAKSSLETESIASSENSSAEETIEEDKPLMSKSPPSGIDDDSSKAEVHTSDKDNQKKEKTNSSSSSEQNLPLVDNSEKQATEENNLKTVENTPSVKKDSLEGKKEAPMEDKDLSQKYKAFNQEKFVKTQGEKVYFYRDGKYSFLINVLSAEKSAKDYVKSLKNQFPIWNFFIKPDSPQLRVYLGPFKTKSEALEFIENLPVPAPFSNYFLEEEGIFP